MQFRKKPVVVDAVYWDGTHCAYEEICSMSNGQCGIELAARDLFIHTLEGKMAATLGDWIIRGVQGEVYPCKPDIFEATYEKVE